MRHGETIAMATLAPGKTDHPQQDRSEDQRGFQAAHCIARRYHPSRAGQKRATLREPESRNSAGATQQEQTAASQQPGIRQSSRGAALDASHEKRRYTDDHTAQAQLKKTNAAEEYSRLAPVEKILAKRVSGY